MKDQTIKPISALKLYYDYRAKMIDLEQETSKLQSLKAVMLDYEITLTNKGKGIIFSKAKQYKKASKNCRTLFNVSMASALASLFVGAFTESKIIMVWQLMSFLAETSCLIGDAAFELAYDSAKTKLKKSGIDFKELEELQKKIDASQHKIDNISYELDKMLSQPIAIEPSKYTTGLEDADYSLQMFKEYLPKLTTEDLRENQGLDLLVGLDTFQQIVDGKLVLASTGEIYDKDSPALKQQQDYDVLWGF